MEHGEACAVGEQLENRAVINGATNSRPVQGAVAALDHASPEILSRHAVDEAIATPVESHAKDTATWVSGRPVERAVARLDHPGSGGPDGTLHDRIASAVGKHPEDRVRVAGRPVQGAVAGLD